MRKTFLLLAILAVAGTLATGCANTERKLGRGVSNMFEVVRMGEMNRTIEQTALWDGPDVGYTTGVIRGVNRTLARTGIGIYEVVTCPLPPYDPVCTDYLTPNPVYPDCYAPSLAENTIFATDANIGFSGGDLAPWLPGSRFWVFYPH
jgi:putative exosortase-associated protein (TIGR04073 family)